MGIDIGSSKTTIIVGELYDAGKNIRILGNTIIPSNGVKKGKIIDVELFSRTLKLGKERLEDKIGIKLKKATVGISGSDITTSTTEVEYKLLDEKIEEPIEVTEEHCNQILEISKQKVVKDDEQILGKEVYNYRLDDSGIMKTPVGKAGKKLEARVHLIKIPKKRVDKVIESLNKADLEAEAILYNGEAGAKAVLKKQDKINGVALVDIGDGLTEITIFKNNRLISTNVIPIGGLHYMNDLRYVLELNGEVIKMILQEMKDKKGKEKVSVTYLDNGASVTKTFDVKYISDIIEARTDEILEYVLKSIEASGYKDYLKNGIVLSGGVVSDYNILEKLKLISDENIRIGTTINISGMTSQLKDPAAVSGMGILLTSLEDEYDELLNNPKIKEERKVAETPKKKEEVIKEKKEVAKEKAVKKPETSKPVVKSKWKKWLGNFI